MGSPENYVVSRTITETPSTPEATVTIPESEYKKLKEDSNRLNLLETTGDN